jgi:hypothetical protein
MTWCDEHPDEGTSECPNQPEWAERRMTMDMSFLNYHFCMMMDAWHDGRLKVVRAEDMTFRVDRCTTEEEFAAIYCIVNDLDNDDVPGMVEKYHEYQKQNPVRPVPSNVELGDN